MSCECDTTCSTIVSVPGPRGRAGENGDDGANGSSACTITTAPFTVPSCVYTNTVTINVADNTCFTPSQPIYIQGAGHFRVLTKTGTTQMLIQNLCLSVNAASGTIIGTGAKVVPSGEPGAGGGDGTSGTSGSDGQNAFTVTTAGFTQPAHGATVAVTVANSAWGAVGQNVFVEGGGTYSISAIPDATHFTLFNLETATEYTGNVPPGTIIAAGKQVSPSGLIGPVGATGATGATGPAGPAGSNGFVRLLDSVASAGAAQAVAFGAWTAKRLQTSEDPNGLLGSLAANTFVLASGIYVVSGHVYAEQAYCRLRIQDITTPATLLRGVNMRNLNNSGGLVSIFGRLVTTSALGLQLQYYMQNDGGATVLGFPMTTGETEIYAAIDFVKIG